MENFDLKEIVRQTIRELATEEMIEYQIRSAVKERFNYKINEEIRAATMEYVHEKGEGYIREKADEKQETPFDNCLHVGYRTFSGFMRGGVKEIIDLQNGLLRHGVQSGVCKKGCGRCQGLSAAVFWRPGN